MKQSSLHIEAVRDLAMLSLKSTCSFFSFLWITWVDIHEISSLCCFLLSAFFQCLNASNCLVKKRKSVGVFQFVCNSPHPSGLVTQLKKLNIAELFVYITECSAAASFIKSDEWVLRPPWILVRCQTGDTCSPMSKIRTQNTTKSRDSSVRNVEQITYLSQKPTQHVQFLFV